MLAFVMNNELEPEIWRPVAGWTGYEVSNYGKMRTTFGGRSKNGSVPMMNQGPPGGYQFTNLHDHGRRKRIGVHQLVAVAFCESRQPQHTEVRHLDGEPSNNYWKNLKWGTRKENHEDAVAHGRMIFGERSTIAKIDNETAREIFASDERNCVLAKRHGISQAAILAIRRGHKWKHVTGGGIAPHAQIYKAGAVPSKLTADQAREIFLSPKSNQAMVDAYGISESFVCHIRKGDKWAEATHGLIAPEYERAEQIRGPMAVSPLKNLTEDQVREIFLSPLLGSQIAVKVGCTESHVSQIRSGMTCGLITVGLTAPAREKQNHKITAEIARKIFVDPRGGSMIAADYKVTRTLVSYIKNRKTWAHATKDLPDASPG